MLRLLLAQPTGHKRKGPSQRRIPKVHLIASLESTDLLQAYCANCHGTAGKGDGPVVLFLDTKVADLTTIAKRNRGIFLGNRARTIIAGDELIEGHGTREMPTCGQIFHQAEKDHDYAKIRLENLTRYVESIQYLEWSGKRYPLAIRIAVV